MEGLRGLIEKQNSYNARLTVIRASKITDYDSWESLLSRVTRDDPLRSKESQSTSSASSRMEGLRGLIEKQNSYNARLTVIRVSKITDYDSWENLLSRVTRDDPLRSKESRKALIRILDRMGQSKIAKVKGLRSTMMAWRKEILEYFKCKLSNGRVEGFNRKAKLLQRKAYGYSSFKNYRLRLLGESAVKGYKR